MALSPSAWRESRFEGSESRPGDRADADRAMHLLDRLDDVDARERQPKRSAEPLNRRRGPHQEGPVDRRRIKRFTRESRENPPDEASREVAISNRGGPARMACCPPAPKRPCEKERSRSFAPSARRNAPQFFKQRVWPIGCFQRVGHQQSVDRAVGERQHLRVDQRRGATFGSGPDCHALFRRHQSQASASAVAQSFEVGRSIAHRGDGKAEAAVPAPPYHAPDEPASDAAEGRTVKALQAEDVERHR